MVAKDHGGSNARRDDPTNSGSPNTPNAEGSAPRLETGGPSDPEPIETPEWAQALFEQLAEHTRTMSQQLRETLLSAQDEFSSRMAAEREEREEAFQREVTEEVEATVAIAVEARQTRLDAEIAAQVATAVEARLQCDVVVVQREVSALQESLTEKLAQLESVADSVGSMQQALADPRKLAQEELDRLGAEFIALRTDVDMIQGMVHDMKASLDESVRTRVRRKSQEFGTQQLKAVLEELLTQPTCRDPQHRELLWDISKQLTRVVSLVLEEDRADARVLRRRISETMTQAEDDEEHLSDATV